LNTEERTMKIGNETVHVTEIDWEKRNWKRILTPEEEREISAKMLRLNSGPDYDPAIERLLTSFFNQEETNIPNKAIKTKGCFFYFKGKRESRKSFET
jgi:hypothetical protein